MTVAAPFSAPVLLVSLPSLGEQHLSVSSVWYCCVKKCPAQRSLQGASAG